MRALLRRGFRIRAEAARAILGISRGLGMELRVKHFAGGFGSKDRQARIGEEPQLLEHVVWAGEGNFVSCNPARRAIAEA